MLIFPILHTHIIMLREIRAAVAFLIRLIERNTKIKADQLLIFKKKVTELLVERLENHWYPDQPSRGQGYRCMRVNKTNCKDATLEQAARACGIKYEDLNLPLELTLWVDPNEVSCRFGEHCGSYCIIASFDGKENKSTVNTEETAIRSELPSDMKSAVDTDKIAVGSEAPKVVKSEERAVPLSASGNGSNKIRRSVNQETSKQNSHNMVLRDHMKCNNQYHLNGKYTPHSLRPWYTLIPQWLPPSPPPPPPPPPAPLPLPLPPSLFHHDAVNCVKWNNQGSPNYHHWQYYRV